MYSETVMDHFKNPRNVGEIENPDGVGEVGNPVCGDIMKIFLKIENNIVADAKFKTFGCGAAIASSSMATELVRGKTLEDAWQLPTRRSPRRLTACRQSRCTARCLPKRASIRRSTITASNTVCSRGKRHPPIHMNTGKIPGARSRLDSRIGPG